MIRLTDEQWERIRDHFPEENIADGRPGRKPTPTRCVLEAVLWILNTGAQWHMLPQRYPNYKTVHRRFQTWCPLERVRARLRECVPMLDQDRYLAPDIAAAAGLVRSGALASVVGVDLPNFERPDA